MLTLRLISVFLLFMTLMTLNACRPTNEAEALQGSILFWHSWQGAAAVTLNGMLNRFEEIYPDVNVISVYVEEASLEKQFELAASLAFGADIVLTQSREIANYVADDLIIPIPAEIDTSKFVEETLITTQVAEVLYGLPMTADSPALYYNPKSVLVGAEEVAPTDAGETTEQDPAPVVVADVPELVREPVATLDALLEQARLGERVLIDTNFNQAIWGIRAFGDQIYDENNDSVALGDGFVAWLEWLQESQNSPAMFLSSNSSLLYELFSAGQAAYYIGDAEQLPALRQALGNDLMVVPLPRASNQPASGYLDTDSLILSRMSSDGQKKLALELARFLTNREQQRRLMRELNRVPANRLVIIDERINPIVAVFKQQVNNAVANPHSELSQRLSTQGNLVYTQVLEGVVSGEEAVAGLQAVFASEPESGVTP